MHSVCSLRRTESFLYRYKDNLHGIWSDWDVDITISCVGGIENTVLKIQQYKLEYSNNIIQYLTFKNRASYIQDGRTAILQMLNFIYFFQQI